MHAEVIAIGDELTSGQRLDTNSQWLSQQLGDLGVRTMFHSTIADDIESNVQAFRIAAERSDILICTGGLGPTADDLTRQAIASAFDLELVQNDDALAHIEGMFTRRGREMPERNTVQALFPETAEMVRNPHGTAPGIDLEIPRNGKKPARLFALPGVPAEMKEMWEDTVSPAISKLTGRKQMIRNRRIKCFGVGESDLEAMLPDLIARDRTPTVGITVHHATITLRVTASGESEEECNAQIEPTLQQIRDCVGELAFGEEDDELENAVATLLCERGLTLAVIEWGTGGQVCQWLSEAAGDEFVGAELVKRFSDESLEGAELVRALAEMGRERFDADLVLAVGPFPPKDKWRDESARLHLALARNGKIKAVSTRFLSHPDILRSRAAKQALNLVRLELLRNE